MEALTKNESRKGKETETEYSINQGERGDVKETYLVHLKEEGVD